MLALLLVLLAGACAQEQLVQVATSRGVVQGFHADYGNNKSALYFGQGDVFLGIPYVQAPIGPLRFQKPQPLLKFPSNPYNATRMRSACPQSTTYNLQGLTMSEDCLFLNIFSPNAHSVYKYPTMVFIHGGAFTTGHAAEYPTDGIVRNFVSRGVVVVTLQYRLALLGFFTTHSPEFPPNLALWDQKAALQWVLDEIPNFGGDPNRVTLFGQSAGSISVSAHLFSPLNQHMFQQAILESGSVLTKFEGSMGFSNMSQIRANKLCNFTWNQWRSGNFSALKKCLQDMPFMDFVQADMNSVDVLSWQIVQDSELLPDVPRNLYARRPNIPVIYGNCRDEWSLVDLQLLASGANNLTVYQRSYVEFVFYFYASYLGDRESDVQGMMESVYVPPGTADDDHVAWLRIINDMFTGVSFTAFVGREIDWFLYMNNTQLYTYEFVFPTVVGRPTIVPGWTPIFHCSELYLLFMPGYLWKPLFASGSLSDEEFAVADYLGQTWTNFAIYGRPTLDDSWQPTRDSLQQEYLSLGAQQFMDVGFRSLDRLLWNNAFPALIGLWPPEMPDYNNGTVIEG